MQDTEYTSSLPQGSVVSDAAPAPQPRPAVGKSAAASQSVGYRLSLLQRLRRFVAGFRLRFAARFAAPAAELRAHAPDAPAPIAFKGETATTLIIPAGEYAGKPLAVALRKRAEQQFKAMDVRQTTVH